MIVDTSALVAVLADEPEAARFTDLLVQSNSNLISAGTLLEARIVAERLRVGEELSELLEVIGAEIVAFDDRQCVLAFEAFSRFGRGRHPAQLNFGDCFAYALAKALDEPLLFKGTDFARTDVRLVD